MKRSDEAAVQQQGSQRRKDPQGPPTHTELIGGSGNVFADVGLPEPQKALAKAGLAEAIAQTIERRRLTQTEAAGIMHVDQPKVSLIVNGRLDGFTQDRLMRYLRELGDDVEIVVHLSDDYADQDKGRLSVTTQARS